MTDSKELRSLIEQRGLKYGYVAKCAGISRQSLNNKINNRTEFKAVEIQKLCDLLQIGLKDRERIFFAQQVEN